MVKVISTSELKQKIDSNEKFYLIDVLAPQSYEVRHIPTAINVVNGPEFAKQVVNHGVSKDDEVIVYCSSATCGASPAAAMALAKAGFTKVAHYKDGLAGWQDAGYEFET